LRNSVRVFLTVNNGRGSVDAVNLGNKRLLLATGIGLVTYIVAVALHERGQDANGVYVSTS